jgi:orotidine-5'-phosphate decarboxylase
MQTKPFADRLVEAIRRKESRVVVGLDPRLEWLPPAFPKTAEGVRDFNAAIIDLVADHAVAVKPQVAFYEQMGIAGMETYQATCEAARKKGLLVIGDVKRGDVPGTAKAYADAHTNAFPCDAITVNPYFGTDGMEPFLEAARKTGGGLFVLVKTSNPSSGEIQDLDVGGKPLHLHVAELTLGWGKNLRGESGYSSVGAVVGATHPEEAARVRAAMPKTFFLVPGYGAQGGGAKDVLPCFEEGGLGAIVSASRSVLFAWRRSPYDEKYGEDRWKEAVTESVVAMKDDINAVLSSPR